MTLDMELIHSKLSDAYLAKKQWHEISAIYPEVNKSVFDEIGARIEAILKKSNDQLNPKEYYVGIGIEAESCDKGLLLTSVYKDCPAAKLGAKVGDIISKINFNTIGNIDLLAALKMLRNSNYEGGIILEIIRNSETITLGYGINAQPVTIDVKRKYPLNFTALTLGKRLRALQNISSLELGNSKSLVKKRLPAMAI